MYHFRAFKSVTMKRSVYIYARFFIFPTLKVEDQTKITNQFSHKIHLTTHIQGCLFLGNFQNSGFYTCPTVRSELFPLFVFVENDDHSVLFTSDIPRLLYNDFITS
ncbi:hypothetical protein ACF0H5_010933 [Mactra antiquata]